jgi:iron-sulfur cluster repair protein YtfE (RIC family)
MDVMEWTVNQALRAAPQSAGVFNRLGVDTCCGGTLTLADAARAAGLAPDDLRAALAPALEAKAP